MRIRFNFVLGGHMTTEIDATKEEIISHYWFNNQYCRGGELEISQILFLDDGSSHEYGAEDEDDKQYTFWFGKEKANAKYN